MRPIHWGLPALLASALLLVPACVQITGQRITWFYDTAADTLHFLIHYDGIHDRDSRPRGSDQLPEFVEDGDVMLFDWPFHLKRKGAESLVESPDPLEREFGQLLVSLETRSLGHYRSPNGRIGAAQLVSIPQATEFVAQANDLISRALLAEGVRQSSAPGFARTLERIQEAAARGHSWIELRGHSIRASLPVHPGEWSLAKTSAIQDMFDEAIQDHVRERNVNGTSYVQSIKSLLGSAPLSYLDEGDSVTFVLGQFDQPTTLRGFVRDVYEDNLEDVVKQSVPQDLDESLARALLDENQELPDPLAPLLAWGPRENQARALLQAWSQTAGAERQAIAERLVLWGARWNRDQGVPEAPLDLDPEDFFLRWASWYERAVNLKREDQ